MQFAVHFCSELTAVLHQSQTVQYVWFDVLNQFKNLSFHY